MKKLILISTCLGLALAGFAQDYEDDIYYNPKTAKTRTTQNKQPKPAATIYGGEQQTYYYYPESTYQENRDVDEYNRFGRYYESAIDTIGNGIANAPDFQYTQEIQKYYNPTIVVDNAAILSDVLDSSYGNVNIIYNNGYPTFSAWYSPWYSWGSPWYYGASWAWNWGPSWTWYGGWYDPWYNPWYYDPWYAWGPGWGWGPTWGWGGAWVTPTRRPGNHVNPGWAANTRPGTGSHRQPGVITGAGAAGGGTRPGMAGINSGSVRPGYSNSSNHRQPLTGVTTRPGSTSLDTHATRPSNGNYTGTRPGSYNGSATKLPSSSTRPGYNGASIKGNPQPGNYTRPGSSTTTTRPSTTTTRPNTSTTRPSSTTRSNSGSFGGGTRGGGFGGGTRGGGSHGGGGGHRR